MTEIKIVMQENCGDLMPAKAHADDAAFDLRSRVDMVLPVRKSVVVPAGSVQRRGKPSLPAGKRYTLRAAVPAWTRAFSDTFPLRFRRETSATFPAVYLAFSTLSGTAESAAAPVGSA